MAQYTGEQSVVYESAVEQPQLMTISQLPTIATQYVEPTIQNTNGITYAQAYTGQPIIYTQPGYAKVVAAPTQRMPTVQQQGHQQSTQLNDYLGNLGSQIQKATVDTIQDNINDKKEEAKKTKEELEKLRQEIDQYKQKEAEEKQNENINKQVKELTEKEKSDLEEQQNQINDTVEAFESFDRSVFMDPDALRNYIDEVDKVSNIEDFRKLVDEEYARSQKENELNKQQNSDYLQHLEKQFSKDQQELTSKQSELNMHESNKSVFKKFIEWITGSKDEKAKELKARLAKLREEIKSDMVKIDDQKDALKKIIEEGVQIMRERTEDMERINKEWKNENRDKREQIKKIVNNEEYTKKQQKALKEHFDNKIQYIQGQMDNKNNYQTYINNVLEQRYPKKDVNNNNSKIMNLNSINEQKKKKDNGRW